MRVIYNPTSGADVTSSVQASMLASRSFFIRYLFRFQCLGFWFTNATNNFVDFCYTTDFPIHVDKYQIVATGSGQLGSYSGGVLQTDGDNFLPEVIQISSALEYKVGFEDHSVDVTWFINDTLDYQGNSGNSLTSVLSPSGLTLKQALLMGSFNECPFWIHQAIFSGDPRRGGTFLGTVLMFRGFIRKVTSSRNAVVLSLASLMDVFQQSQIPSQILTPNCRAIPFLPAAGGTFAGHWTGVQTINSPTSVTFNIGSSVTIAEDVLRDYYIGFTSNVGAGVLPWGTATPPAPFWRVRGNADNGGPSTTVTVYFYEPPIIPQIPSDIPVMAQTSNSGNPPGFTHVPPPEYGI